MINFGKTKWVPHTCVRAQDGKHPQQWSIWGAAQCDGCAARALQGDAQGDGAWTAEDLASAIAEIRTWGGRRGRPVTPAPEDVERVARVQKLLEEISADTSTP